MKKTILSFLSFSAIVFAVHGQTSNHQFDPSNARDGESVEYCITHKKLAEMLADPNAAAQYAADQLTMQNEAQAPADQAKATTYYIPVVFHLLHNNGTEFISDEQILDAFDILNRDYDLQNADAGNVHWDFNASNPSATSIPSDVDIQFRLATKAPNGTCFSGITHTVSNATNSGNGTQQINAIKNGNDVYQGEWPGNMYMNIFICADIGGAAGYTYTPSNWVGSGMSNGIFILHDYCGSIGTASPGSSRALTHEVGHWLNLEHTWGPNNNPGNASSCGDDDGVQDTPTCIGLTSCNLNANTCSQDNGYWGFDMRDNAENYMDYSYCSKMFTPGQVTRMRNALNSSVGGRSNLKTASNLLATGADGNLYLCKAEFSADKTTICAGETIQFSDESFNMVNGWTWTFNGGSPANSSLQNPTVTYSTPGMYEVTLAATDGSNNDSEVKTAYIRVLPSPNTLPFLETFEIFSTLSGVQEWEVFDGGNNAKFEITTPAAHTGARSAKLANFGQPIGNIDELTSAPVDLSGITSTVTMSFRYAYRLRSTSNDEWLKIYVTGDCGDTWVQRKTLHGTMLTNLIESASWEPTSQADWVTVHMTNITSQFWVDNFRYKFRFESDGGNNFFLDDINIYAAGPSDNLVQGVEENQLLQHINLFPNPAQNQLNVDFTVANNQSLVFNITDVTGKIVQSTVVNANEGANLVLMDTEKLSSGMYFLQIQGSGTEQTQQFIVQ